MDLHTQQILKLIKSHYRIKNLLSILSYTLIIGGILVYIFYGFSRNNINIKLVNDYKKNPDKYTTEKTMINPRIKFQYNENEVYDIKAKKAYHENNEEVKLYDVFATGKMGNITAGELKIDEQGNHLVFTKHPVLILNKNNFNKNKNEQ